MAAIRLDPFLEERIKIGVLFVASLRVGKEHGPALDKAIEETERETRDAYSGRTPSGIEGCRPARRLFRSIGVDPTRMRPASEALLRRVLKGGGLPRINPVVDAVNLLSLRFLLPVGLYDADKIEGDVVLRLGREGEGYQRIGKGRLNLHGRIGLFDAAGGFGNPTGDSQRTCVDEMTKRILFVLFAPASFSLEALEDMINAAALFLQSSIGGIPERRAVLGNGGGKTAAF